MEKRKTSGKRMSDEHSQKKGHEKRRQTMMQKKSTHPSFSRFEWKTKGDFLFSALGAAVGLGNFWGFPNKVYKHGGGLFFIPYLFCVSFLAMPLILIECGAAQFIGNITDTFSFCQLFNGLNYLHFMIAAYFAVHYIYVISWTLLYMGLSFREPLPWSHCQKPWATDLCRDYLNEITLENCTDVLRPFDNGTCYDIKSGKIYGIYNNILAAKNKIKPVLPADDYLNYESLKLKVSPGFSDIGSLQWGLVLSLLVAWIIMFLVHIRGAISSSKTTYVTVTLPVLLLVIFMFIGFLQKGSGKGIQYLSRPDAKKFFELEVWKGAAEQAFYSLSASVDVWPYLASNNKFNYNILGATLIITVIDTLVSLLCTTVVFSFIGSFAYRSHVPVAEVVKSGQELAFILIPQELASRDFGKTLSIIYFLMIFCLGVDSQLAFNGAVCHHIAMKYDIKIGSKFYIIISGSICLVSFLFGLVLTTPGGIYIYTLLDTYSGGLGLLIGGLLLICSINIFGVMRFCNTIQTMCGKQPICHIPWRYFRWVFIVSYTVISPLMLLVITFSYLIKFKRTKYKDYVMPIAADVIGWLLVVMAILPVFGYMAWSFYKNEGDWKQKLRTLLRPEEKWQAWEKRHQSGLHSVVVMTEPDEVTQRRQLRNRKDKGRNSGPSLSDFTDPDFADTTEYTDTLTDITEITDKTEISGASRTISTMETITSIDGTDCLPLRKKKKQKKKRKKKKKGGSTTITTSIEDSKKRKSKNRDRRRSSRPGSKTKETDKTDTNDKADEPATQ